MSARSGWLFLLVGLQLARIAHGPVVAQDSPPAEAPSAPRPASQLQGSEDAPAGTAAPSSAPVSDPNPTTRAKAAETNNTRESMCLMIESAASANNLPLEYFARVIWQESRFQPDAVGPVTRNGQRAQGVAQFMPGTASERRLLDPFDPVQALPKAAEFLAELRGQFGNLGLAAAAYNAGPRRVREWLNGGGYMPEETRNYVYAITGTSVDDWAKAGEGGAKDRRKPEGCRELMALLKQAPNPFVAGLEEHVHISETSPWGVQLAAGFSRDKALVAYARAMKKLSPMIGDHDPNLLSSIFRTRGFHPFYQVRIGAETRQVANDLCGKIRKTGGACIVLRNWNARG